MLVKSVKEENVRKSTALGFTLVELLVVISIIAILSVIGITIFSSAQKSAQNAKRRADVKAIINALEIYKTQNGDYPPAEDDTGGADACVTNFPAANLRDRLVPAFIQQLPEDPQYNWGRGPSANYCYFYRKGPGDGVFTLYARLEGDTSEAGTCTGKLYRTEISQFNLCRTNQQ